MRDYMKKYKIFNKLLLLFAVIFGIFGCTTSGYKGGGVHVVYLPAETTPQVVVYSKYVPVNIAETQSYSINASVIPEEESSSALVYSSSDNSIAAVSNDGNVTINKAGIAVINIALEKDIEINGEVKSGKAREAVDGKAESFVEIESGTHPELIVDLYAQYQLSKIQIVQESEE